MRSFICSEPSPFSATSSAVSAMICFASRWFSRSRSSAACRRIAGSFSVSKFRWASDCICRQPLRMYRCVEKNYQPQRRTRSVGA